MTVTNQNEAPTITSNGGGDTAAASVAENSTAVTTVTATDPDAGQTLSYSIVGGADAAKFTINATTGALAFVTAPNFEAPTDAGANNVYDVIVQVSDGSGGIDTQAIAVTVTNQNEPPTITSNGGGDTAAVIVAENTTAVTTVTATDPDAGQTLSYSIVGGADAAKFTINATTGALAFVAAPNFEAPTDAGANNVYDVTVQVSGRQRRDRHSGHRSHGDQPERGPDDHVERRRGHGGGIDCREHHGGDDGHGNRPRCWTDAELCDRRRSRRGQVHDQRDDGRARLRHGAELRGADRLGRQNVYNVIVQVSDGSGGIDTQAIAVTVQNVTGATINGTNLAETLTGTGEEDIINGLGGDDTLNGGGRRGHDGRAAWATTPMSWTIPGTW